MSNKYRQNELTAPDPAKEVNSPAAVTLERMFFDMLLLSRSVQARFDLHTVAPHFVTANNALAPMLVELMEDFFGAVGGFDFCACDFFAGLATKPAEQDQPAGVTESAALRAWRAAFRAWRQSAIAMVKGLALGKWSLRTVLDAADWKPPMPRDTRAEMLEAQIVLRLKSLRDSMAALDKVLMQRCPSLLLEVTGG